MGKYSKLHDYLRGNDKKEVVCSFEVIGQLVDQLPKSAYNPKYSWWGNESSPRRVHALAWLSAGYEAKVDFRRAVVVFTRSTKERIATRRVAHKRIQRSRAKSRSGESKLASLRERYYRCLDDEATYIAARLTSNKRTTEIILDCIREMYEAAKSEGLPETGDPSFESAYHPPISSDLEYLIARILYHYSRQRNLGWKVFLRRQVGKTAPDIRIALGDRTLAIVEVKAKAGWIQCIFSDDRYDSDMKRYREGKGQDPGISIQRFRVQCGKYCDTFGLTKDQMFLLLPSLIMVHRKKSYHNAQYYEETFLKNSGLSEHSFVLLSDNLLLDLSSSPTRSEYRPTDRFERFVDRLAALTKIETQGKLTGHQNLEVDTAPIAKARA